MSWRKIEHTFFSLSNYRVNMLTSDLHPVLIYFPDGLACHDFSILNNSTNVWVRDKDGQRGQRENEYMVLV